MVAGLDVERDGGVVDVVIDHGDANLLTRDMCADLTAILIEPELDDHIVRLRPRGPSFCLGRERAAESADDLRREVTALIALNQALRASRLVSVAEVQGDAAGYGVGLAALSDASVAAPSARFWFPEVDIDLAPVVVLSWLPRLVGRAHAFRLTATGTRIDAAEARAIGLITSVAAADDALEKTVDDVVDDLRERSPRVHAQIRDYLRASADLSEAQAYELARDRLVMGSMERRR